MIPGLGGRGMSPKKMKGMLKNMGIDINELEGVQEVIIRLPDKEIVIQHPSVAVMDAHGVRSYQISGEVGEREISMPDQEAPLSIPDSDVELVVSQTGAEAGDARAALLEVKGDLAAAIIKLGMK
jgi:nascent polypeptide-associated complex subunit alpha